jgi:hypothetical protein
VWYIRFQHERLATTELMLFSTCLDNQLAAKTVNHHLTRGSMLWQATAWLERKQEQPERTPMHQPRLPMSTLGRVRFGM